MPASRSPRTATEGNVGKTPRREPRDGVKELSTPRRPRIRDAAASVRGAQRTTFYRPRRLTLRDGREVSLRAVDAADAPEIVQAFERLTATSRYSRFMQHKKQLDPAALYRAVHPRPGRDFALIATIPAADGIDIVGGARYVRLNDEDPLACEFAITVAEDWRGSGLAKQLLARLVRRARRDGYTKMEGSVTAGNGPMLALARKLKFMVHTVPDDATIVQIQRRL